jgi:hypothetical protein
MSGQYLFEDPPFVDNAAIQCRTMCISKDAALDQTQKIIQNVVRVPSSLYTMNLGSLNVYQPSNNTVGWNQMSDRLVPSVQKSHVSLKSSKSLRPGALTPGGVGCDIKHNSYDRYLAKMKGKYLRGTTTAIVPVSGGKKMKLNLVAGCVCNNV